MIDYAKYLARLIIIQYRNKPKAKQTVELLGSILPFELMFMVRDGFNLETAVGKQLDILGKYIGVDRNYFTEDNVASKLTDDEFRFILKFKCICNNTDMSHASIDNSLYDFFQNTIRASSDGGMQMTYFIPKDLNNVLIASIQKDILPRPMGVGLNYIRTDNLYFGFVTYENQEASVYRTGFRTYNEEDKPGEFLTYYKVTGR